MITVVFNAQETIAQCIQSVINQKYKNVEHIIIDGGSTDGTLQIVNQYRSSIKILVSEPDKGIYDAMNKGITLATGDIIGTLNADDCLTDDGVLTTVAQGFLDPAIEAVYGDLNMVGQDGRIIRKWHSKQCRTSSFNRGFMPPHPTFYCRPHLFKKLGSYSLEFGSAADYELMVRFLFKHKVKSLYLDKIIVTMLIGGVSNKNVTNRLKAWSYDLQAMRKNNISVPALALLLKPLRKMYQYIFL